MKSGAIPSSYSALAVVSPLDLNVVKSKWQEGAVLATYIW